MRAVQIDVHGAPEALRLRDLPDPVAGPGQVVIEVESAAVNWSDIMRRGNDPYRSRRRCRSSPAGTWRASWRSYGGAR